MAKIRYINTNSPAGGNGTTNAITGTDRAYASLQEGNDSEKGSITGETPEYIDGVGYGMIFYCDGTVADSRCSIGNYDWITGNTTRVLITMHPDNRYDGNGEIQTDKYRISNSPSDTVSLLYAGDDRITVDGIQFDNKSNSANSLSTNNYRRYYILKNNVISGGKVGLNIKDWPSIVEKDRFVYNNIVYGTYEHGIYIECKTNPAYSYSGNTVCANNIVYNCNTSSNAVIYGLRYFSEGDEFDCVDVINNISMDNGNTDYNIASGNIYRIFNNTSSDSSLPSGDDNVNSENSSDIFTNTSADNFKHKSSTASGVDDGYSLVGYFSKDILGTSRPQGSAWDRGAFEYVELDQYKKILCKDGCSKRILCSSSVGFSIIVKDS